VRAHGEAAARVGQPLNFPSAADSDTPHAAAKGANGVGPSRFQGVCWDKVHRKWKAQIQIDGKQISLGNFDDEEQAARAYDASAASLGRPLNFPAPNSDAPAAVKGSHGGTSRFKGVSWDKTNRNWKVQTRKDGKQFFLGCFHDEEEAARAYDAAASRLGRPVNFPTKDCDVRAPDKGGRDSGKSQKRARGDGSMTTPSVAPLAQRNLRQKLQETPELRGKKAGSCSLDAPQPQPNRMPDDLATNSEALNAE